MRRGERRSDGDRGRFGLGVLLASLLPKGCVKSIRWAFPEGPWETGLRLLKRHRTVVILISTYLVVRVVLLLIAR